MNKHVWVVTMRRWGDSELHSYVIGVFASEEGAKEAGRQHKEYRGGKYEPDISKYEIDFIADYERSDDEVS